MNGPFQDRNGSQNEAPYALVWAALIRPPVVLLAKIPPDFRSLKSEQAVGLALQPYRMVQTGANTASFVKAKEITVGPIPDAPTLPTAKFGPRESAEGWAPDKT